MPIVFRSMLTEDGRPVVGAERNMLGARVALDIEPDNDDERTVHPKQGKKSGISVSKDWRKLPPGLVPRRLSVIRPGVAGSDSLTLFRFDEIDCETGDFSDSLFLRWSNGHHGSIEPSESMALKRYQEALAATRNRWINAESEL